MHKFVMERRGDRKMIIRLIREHYWDISVAPNYLRWISSLEIKEQLTRI